MKVLKHLTLIKIINLFLVFVFFSCSKSEDTKQIDLTGEWINSDSTSYINIYGERFAFQPTINYNFHPTENVLLFYGNRQDSSSYYGKLQNYLIYILEGDSILYLYKPHDFNFNAHAYYDKPIPKMQLFKYRKIKQNENKINKIKKIELIIKTNVTRKDVYMQLTKDSIKVFNGEGDNFIFSAPMDKGYFSLIEKKISELDFIYFKDNYYGEAGYQCNIEFQDTTKFLNFLYADYESVDKIDILDNRLRSMLYIYQAYYRGFHLGNCNLQLVEDSIMNLDSIKNSICPSIMSRKIQLTNATS